MQIRRGRHGGYLDEDCVMFSPWQVAGPAGSAVPQCSLHLFWPLPNSRAFFHLFKGLIWGGRYRNLLVYSQIILKFLSFELIISYYCVWQDHYLLKSDGELVEGFSDREGRLEKQGESRVSFKLFACVMCDRN